MLIEHLRPAFVAAAVFVQVNAQKHIRVRRFGDVDALLQILPLAGLARGIAVRQTHILAPRQNDLRASVHKRLFHLKGDLQRHVLFPATAVLGPRAAVIASVPGVQRYGQAAERAGLGRLRRSGDGGRGLPSAQRQASCGNQQRQQQAGAKSFRLFCYNFM